VQVETVASNTAQVLWTGIARADRAARVAERVMRPDMFSGWGVRTLSADHPAYDPLGYQQGSIWPFDNALIVSGLKRYGAEAAARRIFDATVDAALGFRDFRLPEFFSGVGRIEGAPPTRAPRADPLQAWSAGALPFMLVELLGLDADGFEGRIRLRKPATPRGVSSLVIEGVRLAGAKVALNLHTVDGRIGASVQPPGAITLTVEAAAGPGNPGNPERPASGFAAADDALEEGARRL
jgi:glycogen debranching enzyme